MNVYLLAAALSLSALAASCPGRNPDPRPFPDQPAGAAGATAAGHGGAYDPGGGGGAPGGDQPLCTLAPSPDPDPALADFKVRHAKALAELGYGGQAAWLLYREPFGSQTTLVAVPPEGPGWTQAKLEQVRFKIGGGFVSVPSPECATCGLKNPCTPTGQPRVAGIAQDAPALPAAGGRRASR